MVEDGHVGNNGTCGCVAERIERVCWNTALEFETNTHVCTREQKVFVHEDDYIFAIDKYY